MILKVKNTFDGWVFYDGLHDIEIRKADVKERRPFPQEVCGDGPSDFCGVIASEVGVSAECRKCNRNVVSNEAVCTSPVYYFEQDFNDGIAEITIGHIYRTNDVSNGKMNIAVVYGAKEGNIRTIAFDSGYLMNDNGKTIETYN